MGIMQSQTVFTILARAFEDGAPRPRHAHRARTAQRCVRCISLKGLNNRRLNASTNHACTSALSKQAPRRRSSLALDLSFTTNNLKPRGNLKLGHQHAKVALGRNDDFPRSHERSLLIGPDEDNPI